MPRVRRGKSELKRRRIQAMGEVEQRIADYKKEIAQIHPKEDDANEQHAYYARKIEVAEAELETLNNSV